MLLREIKQIWGRRKELFSDTGLRRCPQGERVFEQRLEGKGEPGGLWAEGVTRTKGRDRAGQVCSRNDRRTACLSREKIQMQVAEERKGWSLCKICFPG